MSLFFGKWYRSNDFFIINFFISMSIISFSSLFNVSNFIHWSTFSKSFWCSKDRHTGMIKFSRGSSWFKKKRKKIWNDDFHRFDTSVRVKFIHIDSVASLSCPKENIECMSAISKLFVSIVGIDILTLLFGEKRHGTKAITARFKIFLLWSVPSGWRNLMRLNRVFTML